MGRKGNAIWSAGFTLTELLIVMSIIALMSVIIIGIINPIALVNKGKDARRKKDLSRIKTAFEEYYNDKGCYPNQAKVDELQNPVNCDSGIIFSPWLTPWPCDPDGDPYEIIVDSSSSCPDEYRAYAYLEFLADRDIPVGWGGISGAGAYTSSPVNYGVSSPNANWYDTTVYPESCGDICNYACRVLDEGNWKQANCSGANCYWAPSTDCQIDLCPGGGLEWWGALGCRE
ncbi:MAG: prepilin-type N-terminal cleavage/methylation domain-containing protein [Candidatus Shapirobacteria bacterium]|jgi:prepilin-type N-terminal cleavage/methylation domain-containing protein